MFVIVLTAVLDKVTSTVSDHALEKLESLPEEQASRAIDNARAADARSAVDAAVSPPRVPRPVPGDTTVLPVRPNKPPVLEIRTIAAAPALPVSVRGAVTPGTTRTRALDVTSRATAQVGTMPDSDSSGQRDLGLAVISATKVAVDAVCKQLGGVHVQRYNSCQCGATFGSAGDALTVSSSCMWM